MSAQYPEGQIEHALFKRENRLYELDWRSTGAEYIRGESATARALGLSVTTLRVYISTGKAKDLAKPHPNTGELDILCVTQMADPEVPRAPSEQTGKRRGRPPKDLGDVDRVYGSVENAPDTVQRHFAKPVYTKPLTGDWVDPENKLLGRKPALDDT